MGFIRLVPLFGGYGQDDGFRFGIRLVCHAGFNPLGGDENHIADEAEFFKEPNHPCGHIWLGPVHAVAGGAGKSVVVVVPTFPHGEDAEEEVVAAGVGGFKGATAKGVADRVHGPGDVLIEKETDESTPNQSPEGSEQEGLTEKSGGGSPDEGGDG